MPDHGHCATCVHARPVAGQDAQDYRCTLLPPTYVGGPPDLPGSWAQPRITWTVGCAQYQRASERADA